MDDAPRPEIEADLISGGECGRLIAERDWSLTSLGPSEGWPQSLATLLSVVLRSRVPMVLLWGEDGVMLYNDGYAVIAGGRHPQLLGAKVREGWPEAAAFNDHVMKVGLAGGTLAYRNQELTLHRNGWAEQVWFNLDYSPVVDESGRPAGVLAIVAETTDAVRNERGQAFRLQLKETLRDLPDPRAVMDAAVEALGRHLGADRVGYSEVLADDQTINLASCYADGVAPLTGSFPLDAFGPESIARQRQGVVEVCDDVQADPRQVQATWATIDTRAFMSVPLIRGGRFTASLYVNFREPHAWSTEEIALVEAVAARTWEAVERARAEAALRESEARLRLVQAAGGVGSFDYDLQSDDAVCSPEYYALFGLPVGRPIKRETWSELIHPDDRHLALQAFNGAVSERRPFDHEYRIVRADNGEVRWLSGRAGVVFDAENRPWRYVGGNIDVTDRKLAEARLLETTRRLNAVLDNASVAVFLMNGEHRCAYMNAAAERLTGYALSETQNRHLHDVIHHTRPDGSPYPAEDCPIDGVAPGVASQTGEETFVHKSGRFIPVAFTASAIQDEHGEFIGTIVEVQDITARKAAEAELRESEAQLRLATEAAEVGLWDLDPRSDTLFWPPRVKAMFGISADQPISMADFYAGLHPDDAQPTVEAFAAALDPEVRAFYDVEYRTVGKEDGIVRWVAAKGRAIFDDDGTCTRVIGAAIDITARKAVEAELRDLNDTLETRVAERTAEVVENQRRFRGIFDSALQFMALLSPEGEVVEVNETALAWSRIRPEDIVGLPFWDAAPMRDNPALQAAIRSGVARAAGGQTVREEFEMRGAGDVRAMVDFSLKPVLDDGGRPIWLVAEGRDITELKRAQDALRQAQKMEAVGQLTGGIAHDFNNLLQGLSGSLDLIRRKPDDGERVRRWAEAGLQASERGAKLTAQLLAFSRAQKIQLTPLFVSELVGGMRDLFARTLGPMVNLTLDLSADPFPVRSDPTQLEMAVLNLVINARDATPEGGGITVATAPRTLRSDPELPDGDYIELTVTDTGVGMPPEVLARALDPFFTTKGVGKGTGLGLSQVYGIAQQAGGAVRIESEPGKGSRVALILPRTDAAVSVEPTADEPGAAADQPTATVLVVDDDADVRSFLVDSLEGLGYRPLAADSGPSGLALLEQTAPDLLLVDFAMPGMNGAEVARAVRASRPDLPIVFASGYAETAAIEEVVGHGAPILRKPFRVDDLEAVLAEALRPAPAV